MKTEFIEHGIWPRLTNAAKACRGPAAVAVAYFSKGAATLLPLAKGSRLVVDASLATVKAGATCPADLLRLQKKGVLVFSVRNLHAKVYVFGKSTFIGSANASRHSKLLKEAIIRTSDTTVTFAAREFVHSLCQQELGPAELEKLQKLYRPPTLSSKGSDKHKGSNSATSAERTLRLVKLTRRELPTGADDAILDERKIAIRKRRKHATHELDEFCWPSSSIREHESVVQVTSEKDGKGMVSPPGKVLHTKVWSNGKARCTFVYLEVPRRKRKSLQALAEQLGKGSRKRLSRSGRVNTEFAERLRSAWR